MGWYYVGQSDHRMVSMDKISIAISTRNRPSTFKKVVHEILKKTPIDVMNFFTVDDASDYPYSDADYRFKERAGISAVKNKCLQLCYESDADHFFLFDDDTYPISDNWWIPYVKSKQQHLSYTFGPGMVICSDIVTSFRLSGDHVRCTTEYHTKSHIVPNGCMTYFTRECIDKVGGFDTNYPNKYEHTDLSRRIFNSGITQTPYIDVVNSDKLIYCLDQDIAIQRSFTEQEMKDNLNKGYEYFRSREKSSAYIEFRT